MPISTTHASVSSILGIGLAKVKGVRGINWRIVGYILTSWVLTVPVAAALSFTLYLLLSHLIP